VVLHAVTVEKQVSNPAALSYARRRRCPRFEAFHLKFSRIYFPMNTLLYMPIGILKQSKEL